MLVAKELTVAIDFWKLLRKPMATINCLVINTLQNIFFCVQQLKEKKVEGD